MGREGGRRLAREEVPQRAHEREDGVLPRALLLCEAGSRRLDGAAQHGGSGLRLAERDGLDGVAARERIVHGRDEHLSARVERLDREGAPRGLEAERRVDEAHRPAGIPVCEDRRLSRPRRHGVRVPSAQTHRPGNSYEDSNMQPRSESSRETRASISARWSPSGVTLESTVMPPPVT